jgi:hypothetical protein
MASAHASVCLLDPLFSTSEAYLNTGADISVAHVIQQAVAPVFLLTGVGAILGVLTNRLSRIVDRFRTLDSIILETDRLNPKGSGGDDAEHHTAPHRRQELAMLSRRRTLIHGAIILCTLCALLICVVIATLFLSQEFGFDPSRIVAALFVAAMLSLISGLVCFLREIALATQHFESR